ncbi:hypothetical protein DQ04_01861060 [Trypanosoma grayi]|uniref:hypothetical protein n=1 Tax=Trypanosoma grayi TaxID=71804 RepID=UPI0004F41A7D|nr:hypothetical protein DQ04_01861060 [Trypanosoma grayi]KEG12247.1 hypothetical protein DQ04_01861060 [Trypanosoma grayi]
MRRVLLRTHGSRRAITITGPLLALRHRGALLTPVDPIADSASSSAGGGGGSAGKSGPLSASTSYRFALKDVERGLYDHGVTPDARAAIAEAEAQYKASADYLHAVPGGVGMPELRTDDDGSTVSCITAPLGEEYVPSHKERYALRGHVGELGLQRKAEPKYLLSAQAELNLRKERQLRELLSSPMPLLEKASETERMLHDFYAQRMAVSSRNVEAIAAMWAHCSLEQRLSGSAMPSQLAGGSSSSDISPTAAASDAVPFLAAMRRLYFHARQTHVAPTPLVLEYLMTTLSALTVPDSSAFHLANRLYLDADKYVVLPTRTTYAAYFTICNLHNAMSFALARFNDAVANLHIGVDAAMATALLKGLSQNGLVEEAVALLARLQHIPLDVQFFNASLEVLLLSEQPQACFAAFDALRSCPVEPTAETYTLLLLACERSGLWGRATAILADMQRRRVKGDSKTLNLLLKGLLTERLHSYARQLYETMTAKNVEVWPALEAHMGLSTKKQKHQQQKQQKQQRNLAPAPVRAAKGF